MYLKCLVACWFLALHALAAQTDYKKMAELRAANQIGVKHIYEFDPTTQDSLLTDQHFYNAQGQMIKDLRFDTAGAIRYRYVLDYNDKDQLVRQTGYDETGAVSTILTHTYDAQGNPIEYFQHRPDGTQLIYQKRIYDDNNRNTQLYSELKGIAAYHLSGTYFYNPKGQYTKTESFDPYGNLTTSIYTYTKSKHKVFEVKNGKKVLSSISKYNKEGLLVQKHHLKSDQITDYQYDAAHNLIQEQTFKAGQLIKKIKFYYQKRSEAVFIPQIDTLYTYGTTDKSDPNNIRKMIFTLNDSTKRTAFYWKGKITTIEYTGTRYGCPTPIQADTAYDRTGMAIRRITRNQVTPLGQYGNCDSLLLVQTTQKYQQGQLTEVMQTKRLGLFSEGPCGEWSAYKDGELLGQKTFGSCYDGTMEHLVLTDTIWSPDRQFKLELYKEQLPFAMPGQGSDHVATVILKDKNDQILQYISGHTEEKILYRDLQIKWALDQQRVWYGEIDYFELGSPKR